MPGVLTHSPADVLRRILIDLGHGTSPSDEGTWPISVGVELDSPDNTITLYDTVGKQNGRLMTSGERQEKPGIQVRVRAVSHVVGYTRAQLIATQMATNIYLISIKLDSTTYEVWSVSRTTNVLALGRETPTSKRHLFTVNAIMTLKQS